jgi:hypothetical protein
MNSKMGRLAKSWISADLVLQQQLHHLQVLVVDPHEEGGAAQRVDTVYVHAGVGLQHTPDRGTPGSAANGCCDNMLRLFQTFMLEHLKYLIRPR